MNTQYCLVIIISVLLTSCGISTDDQIQAKDRELSSLKEKLTRIENENEVLVTAIEDLKKTNVELNNKNNDLRFEISPAGIDLGQYYASDNNEYKFGKDSLVVLTWNKGEYKIGKWIMKNDTVKMQYYKEVGKRGIGEPLAPPPKVPGNYNDRYEKYEDTVKAIKETDYLIWSQVKRLLTKDSEYPYKLLGRNKEFDLSDLDKDLTEH